MSRRKAGNPYALGLEMWTLGMDSAMVMGLRTLKLATGGAAAATEAQRMIEEKLIAAVELPFVLGSVPPTSPEALSTAAIRHYSAKVRANRRRLSGRSTKA